MTPAEIDRALKRPFPVNQLSWRVGATSKNKDKAIALAYIDARDVMHRFDEVFGLGWQNRYTHAEGKTICEIGVLLDGQWIWRAGGAGDTDIEAEKGAISDAFKRAAVLFGVGRYLYDLPNVWVPIDEYKRLKETPNLPSWATPEGFDSMGSGKTAREQWLETTAMQIEGCETADELKTVWAAAVKVTRAEEDGEAYDILKPVMERMAAFIKENAKEAA